jgi:hypothetical protein
MLLVPFLLAALPTLGEDIEARDNILESANRRIGKVTPAQRRGQRRSLLAICSTWPFFSPRSRSNALRWR